MKLKDLLRMGYVLSPDEPPAGEPGGSDQDLEPFDLPADEPASSPPPVPTVTLTQAELRAQIDSAASIAAKAALDAYVKAQPAPAPVKVDAAQVPDNDDDLYALKLAASTVEEEIQIQKQIEARHSARFETKASKMIEDALNRSRTQDLESRKGAIVEQLARELVGDDKVAADYILKNASRYTAASLASLHADDKALLKDAALHHSSIQGGPSSTGPRTGGGSPKKPVAPKDPKIEAEAAFWRMPYELAEAAMRTV